MFAQQIRFFITLVIFVSLYACGGGQNTDANNTAPKISKLEIQVEKTDLIPNSEIQLSVIAKYNDQSEQDITSQVNWKINDENVASIDKNGKLHINNLIDTLEISAEYQNFSASKTFQITEEQDTSTTEEPQIKSLVSLSISNPGTTLTSGETILFSLQGAYSDGSTSPITTENWTTTGPVSLNENKTELTALSVSETTTAILSVEIEGVSVSLEFTIEPKANEVILPVEEPVVEEPVTEEPVEDGDTPTTNTPVLETVSLDKQQITLTTGENSQLTLTANYDNAPPENPASGINWESSNPDVAKVDANGKVNAIAEGTATITATYESKIATATITVKAPPPTLTSVSLNTQELTLTEGDSSRLTLTANYDNAPSENPANGINWESSNPDIAKVDANGMVSAITAGTATITATYASKTATATITVEAAVVTLEQIVISVSKTTLSPLENLAIGATGVYSDASESDITNEVSWLSSKPSIINISSDAGIALVAQEIEGTSTISASLDGVSSSVDIKVIIPDIVSVYIDNPPTSLFFNSNISLKLRANLSDSRDIPIAQNIVWESSNDSVASINSAGIVQTNNVDGYTVFKATYTDTETNSTFSADIGVNVVAENSFENLNLSVADLPQKTLIEDNSDFPPVLKAYNNPVGITQDIIFKAAVPGTFVTYTNPTSHERLVLVLPSNTPGTYDKTTAHVYYVPVDNAQTLYLLDDTSNTDLSIDLINYGATGEYASGQFSATLCTEAGVELNACQLSANQLKMSGSFYITVEEDAIFKSDNNPENPILIHPGNFDVMRQIATEPNYYYEITNKGVTYDFTATHPDVQVEVVKGDDMITVLATSSVTADGSEQVLTSFIAEQEKTYLRASYIGSDSGATFTIHNAQGELAAQGSATTPFVLGNGKIPLISFGTVDLTSSYYELDVLSGHRYLVHLTNIQDADKNVLADLSLEVADTNNSGSYQACTGLTDCEILSTTGKIFFKVNGHPAKPASFDIEVEYAPERFPDVTLPIVDRVGQVSYKVTLFSAVGSNADFKSGTSNYWIPADQLTANTHYLISIKGLTAFTMLWTNDPSNGALTEQCASGGSWAAPATQNADANLNEIYCVVKTKSFIRAGFAINIIGEASNTGTPYILNVAPIDASKVFYVSTYGNGATGCMDNNGSCAPLIGMNFYRPGEDNPFTFTLFTSSNYAQKALVLEPGETVFIRLFDARNYGNFYSMQVRNDAFNTNSTAYRTVDDPDSYEADAGDNSAANATVIQLNEETHHSFSSNNGQFGDEDWFSFTAPTP